MKKNIFLQFVILLSFSNIVFSQIITEHKKLKTLAGISSRYFSENHQKALSLAKQHHWALEINYKNDRYSKLIGVDQFNQPVYYSTFNNIVAAATVGATQLWTGGTTGLNLSGSSDFLKNKLAIWDGGGVRGTHIELAGRVTQMDGSNVTTGGGSIHATHVTGTMMATGINSLARGMSYQLQGIHAYDFNDHITEMTGAASGLLLSNHSYGTICGWDYDVNGNWMFYGKNGDTADYNFGYYNKEAADWDNIAYNAPYYLIVKASGNNRNVNGPAIGGTYYYKDVNGNEIQGNRPTGISNNNGYDIIGTYGNAKNILTVGAVYGITNGYSKPEDVIMTPFSSWGPTDDGRIKPDLVADGVNVLSCSATSDSDYVTESGSSMSTPNVTGALMLLQEYYAKLSGGNFMRSATLKGLAIHTADEAGPTPGPDYQFGWGLLDVKKGADVLTAAVGSNNSLASKHLLYEKLLLNGQTDSIQVIASGSSPIIATICWTDPAGSVDEVNVLNNPTPKLVNDLDMRINSNNSIYFPWIMTPTVPSAAATKGDNYLDNVEKIEIDSIVPGQVYTIKVTHKNSLSNGSQAYSLLISGAGGTKYCIPDTLTKNIGTSIDSVSFAEINNVKSNCTTYSNFKNLTATIKPNQTIPISIKLGSCNSLSSTKILRVYIDFNNNGTFTDNGELVATGNLSGINNIFSSSIKIPVNVSIGSYSILRIVATDSMNADNINPCNTYTSGETQDYKVFVSKADNDIALTSFLTPSDGDYASGSQLVVVSLTNNGISIQQNIGLTAIIKQGNDVVASLSGNYPSPIASGATMTYTFQTPFFSLPATNYSITATATVTKDDNPSNNSLTKPFTTAQAIAATANNCNQEINLNVTKPSSATQYTWYNAIEATTPIATGSSAVLNNVSKDKPLYLSSGTSTNVGLVNKGTYTGGYQTVGNNFLNYTSTVPMILENARIYTGYPGTINVMVADIFTTAGSTTYSYKVLNSKNVDVYCTKPTPVNGSITGNDLTDTGAVFYINLVLPAGSHSIIVATNDATIYRTNGLPIDQYPFGNSQFKITGNSAALSNTSDTNYYKPYYYYLYNMKLKSQDCKGDRLPINIVTSPTPNISISNDSLVSNISEGNHWYLNGNEIAGATTASYLANSADGYYFDLVTDSFGCSTKSKLIYIDRISPIVTTGFGSKNLNLHFVSNIPNTFNVSLENISGKRLFVKTYQNIKGNFSEQFDTSAYASGVYILEIRHGNYVDRKKVLILH